MYEELVKVIRNNAEHYMTVKDADGLVRLLADAADAIEELTAENKRLKSKIRDMKSSASWDEDIQRGQVQGMW